MVFIRRTREYLLHLGAKEEQFQTARSMRHEMTEAESLLWNELKNRKMSGLKFRRQHPIHYYVADFYCHEKKLIIEVDGGIHNSKATKEHDENRSAEFERLGIRVIRVTNEQVLNSWGEVIEKINIFLDNDSGVSSLK
jgi:cyclase